jgi:elongation factor P
MKANRLRKGDIITFEGELYRVFEALHQTPGNLRARMQTRLKGIRTGVMKDVRFRAEEDVEKAYLDHRTMQYLYQDAAGYHFMDTDSYDQVTMSEEDLGDGALFLVPETMIQVQLHEGSPVGVDLPATVDLRVVETTPEVKGATASAQNKPATLETGLVVQVPAFVKEGEMIRVRTEDSAYMERVK